MKAEITSPEQVWFLLSVLGADAVTYLKSLQPKQVAATGRMIVWLGKSLEEKAAAAAAKVQQSKPLPLPAPEMAEAKKAK